LPKMTCCKQSPILAFLAITMGSIGRSMVTHRCRRSDESRWAGGYGWERRSSDGERDIGHWAGVTAARRARVLLVRIAAACTGRRHAGGGHQLFAGSPGSGHMGRRSDGSAVCT
jgi:hypothetical protein